MKKLFYPFIFSLLILFSCNETDNPDTICGVTDPLNDLPWLKTLQQGLASEEMSEYNYIGQASYEGETVFYLASCCPNCNWQLVSYDCSGDTIEGDYALEDLEGKKVIWKSEDSECVFD
ncbi:hypothetical protein [uncultured Cyclobacterium sp.]|uniref:hypothetical protein n=1 Tax=uncultured Cyclobacterium sp. TaxID=453820 RepID=UPI0030EC04D2|tara:strand:- start:92865 stop:93221 length:357 start_codon:yes stop_codon:yes gene_type:complete